MKILVEVENNFIKVAGREISAEEIECIIIRPQHQSFSLLMKVANKENHGNIMNDDLDLLINQINDFAVKNKIPVENEYFNE